MKLMKSLRNRLRKNLINNRSGQGATEYILLLVVIVGLVMLFGPKIRTAMTGKMDQLSQDIDNVKGTDK